VESARAPGFSSAPPKARSGPASGREAEAPNRPRVATLGDFQILKKLGGGAMGVVSLARQAGTDRLTALKVLSKALASQPDYVQRFFREASVLSRLHHPNIVEFCEVGEENGLPYFAMEFIDGFTLDSLLERRGGRLAVGDALYVVMAAARALAYAHERNVIHRDVKPSNIMVNRLGQVKITDLGLAWPLDEDLSLTTSGASIGAPHYMAPEQARNGEQPDPRCDVYGLGGVLYHLLTGTIPFQGDSVVALMLAKERGHFPSARQLNHSIPDRLDLIIDKMLAKDLRYRYPNCYEAIRDMESLGLAEGPRHFNPLHVASAAERRAEEGGTTQPDHV
jgi:eukaryotic-like serine/threonine-protein kinase